MDLSDEITESDLLDLCNNLLIIDSEWNVWRFSHLSVTEYFETNHWTLQRAHRHCAIVCLKLLIKTYGDVISDGTCDNEHSQEKQRIDIFDRHRLLLYYAQYNWIVHTQAQDKLQVDSILAPLLKFFLGSPEESSPQYFRWYRGTPRRRHGQLEPETIPLFAMCQFSLHNILLDWYWWDAADFDVSQINTRGNSLLALAAKYGHQKICENLVKQGIEVNLPTGEYGSALAVAVRYGHTEVVKFLAEKAGADVNMALRRGKYGSALATAAAYGEKEAINLLLDAGADINMPLEGDCGSALEAAVANGNSATTESLLDAGADVNMPLMGTFGSALAAAILQNLSVAKYLVLVAKANVNQQLRHGKIGSALATAAFLGRTDCIKFLIEIGANVNLRIEDGPLEQLSRLLKETALKRNLDGCMYSMGQTSRRLK